MERKLLDSVGKGRRINDISIAELDKLLIILAKLVGIRNDNLPDKEESLLLIRSLNRVYPNVKEEEIKIAFELAASGQIECEEHYQSFNFKYIASIINSYIKQVNESMKYVTKEIVQAKPIFEPIVDWSDTIDFLINEFIENREPIIPSSMYDWMIEKNIISVSKKDKIHAMNMGERILKRDIEAKWSERPNSVDRADLYELERGYDKSKPIYNRVVNEAKKYIIKNYLIDKAKEIKKHSETNKGS